MAKGKPKGGAARPAPTRRGAKGKGGTSDGAGTSTGRVRVPRFDRAQFLAVGAPAGTGTTRATRAGGNPPGKDKDKRFSGALFPSIRTVSCYYKPKALLRWATNRRIAKSQLAAGGSGSGTGLPYKLKNGRRGGSQEDGDGGAKEYDHAWFVISEAANKEGTGASWRALADMLKKSKYCTLFDMHSQGIADACYMLASSENKQPCPEMPNRLPHTITQTQAFHDEKDKTFHRGSVDIAPAPMFDSGGRPQPAVTFGDAVDCRPTDHPNHSTKVPIHQQIDQLHNHGRLPAMMPHTSTKVEVCPPLRWQSGSGVEVNAVKVFEHVSTKMEGILLCSKTPGLQGLQENFLSGGSAPPCLKAEARPAGVSLAALSEAESTLPYSIDVQQMAWTIELAQRFYNTGRKQAVGGFNAMLQTKGLPHPLKADASGLPELSLRFPGYPTHGGEPGLRLISVPVGDHAPVDNGKKVEISTANPLQSIDGELLRYQTEVAIGREATQRDIEEHRRSLIGTGYVWGVTGDVFNYDTWQDHLCASLIGRGNVDAELDLVDGGFADKAFEAVVDAEYMFGVRLVERRSINKLDPEAKYDVSEPTGSTYKFLETQAERAHSSRTRGKRVATSAPCQMDKKRGSYNDQMRVRRFAPGPAAPSSGGSGGG